MVVRQHGGQHVGAGGRLAAELHRPPQGRRIASAQGGQAALAQADEPRCRAAPGALLVAAVHRQLVAVDTGQHRMRLGQQARKALRPAVLLDIGQVPQVLHQREPAASRLGIALVRRHRGAQLRHQHRGVGQVADRRLQRGAVGRRAGLQHSRQRAGEPGRQPAWLCIRQPFAHTNLPRRQGRQRGFTRAAQRLVQQGEAAAVAVGADRQVQHRRITRRAQAQRQAGGRHAAVDAERQRLARLVAPCRAAHPAAGWPGRPVAGWPPGSWR